MEVPKGEDRLSKDDEYMQDTRSYSYSSSHRLHDRCIGKSTYMYLSSLLHLFCVLFWYFTFLHNWFNWFFTCMAQNKNWKLTCQMATQIQNWSDQGPIVCPAICDKYNNWGEPERAPHRSERYARIVYGTYVRHIRTLPHIQHTGPAANIHRTTANKINIANTWTTMFERQASVTREKEPAALRNLKV